MVEPFGKLCINFTSPVIIKFSDNTKIIQEQDNNIRLKLLHNMFHELGHLVMYHSESRMIFSEDPEGLKHHFG